MFQYEYERKEKRPSSTTSCESRATMTTDWSRGYPAAGTSGASGANAARRPLPPRPTVCERIPAKPTVPLKVWIVASASCFAVCAVLVLATVVITKWGAGQAYTAQLYESAEPVYSNHQNYPAKETTTDQLDDTASEEDIQLPILEKLPMFRNAVANRDKKVNLASKPQIHPLHESIEHEERKIEKKDQAKLSVEENTIPDFKPTLPDIFINKHKDIKLSDGYIAGLRKHDDYEDYYNDENLYEDYLQSNTMTSYLIEKVQELHNWITSDPDFVVKNNSKASDQFGQVLKALNDSILEGNASIVMTKLRDIYFGDNNTMQNHSRKVIVTNSTDLLSFGILSLDVMLLHNIQLMAWENQEATRLRMLKDPDVFAFNALFMDPAKIDGVQNELNHHYDNSGGTFTKRQNPRQQDLEDYSFGENFMENVLEVGVSAARAAIHLGRAYRNTKSALGRAAPHELSPGARRSEEAALALSHLHNNAELKDTRRGYTELDCVWLLYCRNLIASSKLHPPYNTMARINGLALRMVTGELPAERALDAMLYEALAGWTELKCDDMFPRCSKVNAAAVVLDSIMQPLRKAQANKVR